MPQAPAIPIKGFIETSFVDWPGKICSVIFLSHCNFRCRYCHNAELVLRHEALKNIEFDGIMDYLESQKGWIDGVCVSGGEPTLYSGLPELLDAIKADGFLAKLDTNGSNPQILKALIDKGLVDFVAMDVKASLNETSYCAITQAADMLVSVKKSIRIIIDSGIDHEFRCTVLPSYHNPDAIVEMARELNGAHRLRIQNFNPDHTLDPSLKTLQPYTEDIIDQIQQRVNNIICA
jgi:pyruvate formate lyase activating enzyme